MNPCCPSLTNQSGPAWMPSVPALTSRDILSGARDYLSRLKTGMRACALLPVIRERKSPHSAVITASARNAMRSRAGRLMLIVRPATRRGCVNGESRIRSRLSNVSRTTPALTRTYICERAGSSECLAYAAAMKRPKCITRITASPQRLSGCADLAILPYIEMRSTCRKLGLTNMKHLQLSSRNKRLCCDPSRLRSRPDLPHCLSSKGGRLDL
jgi:hypothetical protein